MRKLILLTLWPFLSHSQHIVNLEDLSEFEDPTKNWSIQQSANCGPWDSQFLISSGKGVLVNTLVKGQENHDLISRLKHGDIHLKFEYKLPKGSNSGIYLQGRYEVQLLDSWKKKHLKYGDNGGIYERWDETRGKGNQGYEGNAPLVNASKAPGLWQEIEIDFQAPRFDSSGNKIENAKFKKVVLNGVLIHQNIELTGVTRGSMFEEESAFGPIRIQGDHGPIAIRNFWYETFDLPSVTLRNIQFKTYQSEKENQIKTFNTDGLEPVQVGKVDKIDQNAINPKANFLTNFEGELEAPSSEDYEFELYFTGSAQLWVDGQKYFEAEGWYNTKNTVMVPISKGKHRFNLVYVKDFPWGPRALGVYVKRVGAEKIALHDTYSLPEPEAIGMIEYEVGKEPVFQRSFMFEEEEKNTYVMSVGTPEEYHYSYDLKKGDLIYIWRGRFLDVTQMWENRGEPQSAEPLGQRETILGKGSIYKNGEKISESWEYKGYQLKGGIPQFRYQYGENKNLLKDLIVPNEDLSGLKRQIQLEKPENLTVVMARGESIISHGNGLWEIDGKYFIRNKSEGIQIVEGELRGEITAGDYSYEIIW